MQARRCQRLRAHLCQMLEKLRCCCLHLGMELPGTVDPEGAHADEQQLVQSMMDAISDAQGDEQTTSQAPVIERRVTRSVTRSVTRRASSRSQEHVGAASDTASSLEPNSTRSPFSIVGRLQ